MGPTPGVDPDERSYAEMAEEEPGAFFIAVGMTVGLTELTDDELLELAVRWATEEQINLFKLINEHPDLAERIFGQRLEFSEAQVQHIDGVINKVS